MTKLAEDSASKRRVIRRRVGATLAELAAAAGVSTATASRALNTPHLLSQATLARVHAAVASTGYIPSLISSAAITNRTRLVAMLLPQSHLAPFEPTIRAVVSELSNEGYQSIFGIYSRASTREQIVTQMLSRRPEGMIMIGMPIMAAARDLLIAAKLPIVETWEIPREPLDMIAGISHEDCGTTLGNFLLSKGYRRPHILDVPISLASLRHDRVSQVLTNAGQPAPARTKVTGPSTIGEGRQMFTRIVASGTLPDVIVCADDLLAHGVLIEARMRGVRVPDELAVVGFGGLDYVRDLEPPLTTMRIDGAAIGREAARLMLKALSGKPVKKRIVDVGFTFVERGTT